MDYSRTFKIQIEYFVLGPNELLKYFIVLFKIRNEYNIFKGVCDNPLFLGVVIAILGLQIIIVQFGSRAFNCSSYGLNIIQWVICIAFASITWIWSVCLKAIPFEKICPRFGNKLSDPLHSDSNALKLRRSRQGTLNRKYSSLQPGKHGSLSKVQYHQVPQS